MMAVRIQDGKYVIGDEDPHSFWNTPQEELLDLQDEYWRKYKEAVENYVGDFIRKNPDADFANPEIQASVYKAAEEVPEIRQLKETSFMYEDALAGTTDPEFAKQVADRTYRSGGVTVVGAVGPDTEAYRRNINRAIPQHVPRGTVVIAGHGETGEDFPPGAMLDFPTREFYEYQLSPSVGAVYREAVVQNPDAECLLGAHCSGGGLSDVLLGQLSNLSSESGKAILIPGGFVNAGARNTTMDTRNPLGYIEGKEKQPASITATYPFGTKVYTFDRNKVPYKEALRIVYASPEYKKYLALRNQSKKAST